MANRNILLIEPGYKNKYPPLGLMKIAQYHGPRGRQDNVRFIKGEDRSVLTTAWDRIYITTLFSFEYARIEQSIDFAVHVANGHRDRVFVGGIAASLMHERFAAVPKWHGVRFVRGLLGEAPAVSLELDAFSEELYSDDLNGTPIEDLVPDYSILDHISYRYPVSDAYFTYASRGCIRKCSFCGVPELEGAQRDASSLTALVRAVDELYGIKKDLTLMDNNVVASPTFKELIAEIRDLGFTPGAKLKRGRVPVQRRVDFNQGVDARILCKSPMYLRELATICIKPLRVAFDHLGLRAPYEQAIRYAHEFGLTQLSNYLLYNFHDTPADLYERMHLNVRLNEELGMRIWSFPMRYQPTNLPDRSHIGEHWSRYELRSMQIILQATHGIVSGAPDFFCRAFGCSADEFREVLLRPHHQIFNREWYEAGDGRGEYLDFRRVFRKLSESDRSELLSLLSSCDPREIRTLGKKTTSSTMKRILPFYIPISQEVEVNIWAKRRAQMKALTVDEEGRVEDADLEDVSVVPQLQLPSTRHAGVRA